MDRHTLAVLIPTLVVFFSGLIVFSFTRLGRAVAKRIEGGSEGELADRLARLEIEQDRLIRELADAHERLDNAERIIACDAGRNALPGRQAATPVP